jgi:hypothetical protein
MQSDIGLSCLQIPAFGISNIGLFEASIFLLMVLCSGIIFPTYMNKVDETSYFLPYRTSGYALKAGLSLSAYLLLSISPRFQFCLRYLHSLRPLHRPEGGGGGGVLEGTAIYFL